MTTNSSVDIGSTQITTLGSIGTGVWQASTINTLYGGTGKTSFTAYSVVCGGTNSTQPLQSVASVGTSGQVLTSNGASALPTWATPTTGTVTSVSGTASRITSTGGATPVIDISASYVGQSSITTLGTITTGVWSGTTITVAKGGTGKTSFTAYALVCAGTTTTGAFQDVGDVGTQGQVLMSNGASSTPVWNSGFLLLHLAGGGAFTLANNSSYLIVNFSGLSTLTLPASSSSNFGAYIQITGENDGTGTVAAGWKIAQNASQSIQVGSVRSTAGTGGSVASTNNGDSITLICDDATNGNTWRAVSFIGNLTVV